MATPEQCPAYEKCGFVKWRKDRPDAHVDPIPENGDCGVEVNDCMRLKVNEAPTCINLTIDMYGPQTHNEMDAGLPIKYEKNGRPSRIVGGGNQ